MATLTRWQHAQEYERGYWQDQAERITGGSAGQLQWYEWRAGRLAERLRDAGLARLADGTARVLEVGSGPIGVVSYFPASERIAVDPLEDFYGSNETLSALRNPDVDYRQGVGERLPVGDDRIDLAIIENCIDHVQDMDGVMSELSRTLGDSGTLYLTVNCRSRWGYVVHRILSRLRLDPGHPHTFTPKHLRKLLARHGYRILSLETESFMAAWKTDLTSSSNRARIKGLLGVSEYVALVIAARSAPHGSR